VTNEWMLTEVGVAYVTAWMYNIWMNEWMNDTDRGKTKKTWWKACPSITLSTINPMWTGWEMRPGLHSYGPVTNHLTYSMAWINQFFIERCIASSNINGQFISHMICTNKHYTPSPCFTPKMNSWKSERKSKGKNKKWYSHEKKTT